MPNTLLGLDVGEARIGLARAEESSSFAFGRGFIRRTTLAQDIEAIRQRMKEEKANILVLGLPKRTDGNDSVQTERVRAFAKALEEAGFVIVFEDERFTTRIASQSLSKSGLSKQKRQEKGRLDETAAILILESYLQRQKTL